jgi:hypothetical protein
MSANRSTEFLTPFCMEDITPPNERYRIKLTNRLGAYSALLQSETWLEKGFESDGESIPGLLHSLVPPLGGSRRAALFHDGFYKFAGYFDGNGIFHPMTRALADKVYLELSRAAGISTWRAWDRYLILRATGGIAWRNHRKAK